MKTIFALFASIILCSMSAKADLISNGDFNQCNFNAWTLETDLLYSGTSPDFQIRDNNSDCYAEISIERDNSNAERNRLYQAINDIGSLDNISFDYWLNIEQPISGVSTSTAPDKFWVALTDGTNRYDAAGNLGSFLIGQSPITAATTQQTFSTDVTGNFDSSATWFIEFMLIKGTLENQVVGTSQSDMHWSSLSIDNVSLASVNEPTHVAFIAFGVLLMLQVRRKPQ